MLVSGGMDGRSSVDIAAMALLTRIAGAVRASWDSGFARSGPLRRWRGLWEMARFNLLDNAIKFGPVESLRLTRRWRSAASPQAPA